MKYLNFKNDYTLIKTDKIDTVVFTFVFPVSYVKGEMAYFKILNDIITQTSEKYPDNGEYNKARIKSGVVDNLLTLKSIGSTYFLKYEFEIPRENLIKDYSIEEAFSFAIDSLMKPFIKDKKFDQSQFDYEKNYLIRADKFSDENIDSSNDKKLWDIVDKEELTGLTSEHYKEALEKLNNERLYELYLENIYNNKPFIYVYGNIERETLDKLFDKYYPLSKNEIKVEKNYMTLLPDVAEDYIEVPTKFNQTELVMVYQVDVTEDNYFRLHQLRDFLSSKENNLIFKTLRTEHNLVYHAGTHTRARSGILFVDALIQDKNIDEAIKLVNGVFESLKDKKVLAECLSKAQKYVSYDLLVEEDNSFNELRKVKDADLELNGLENVAKLYEETTVDDMLDFIQNVKHTSTIIFRGVGNDKNND